MSKGSLIIAVVSIVVGLFVVVNVLPFINGEETGYTGNTAVVSSAGKAESEQAEVVEAPVESVPAQTEQTTEVVAPVEQLAAEAETVVDQMADTVTTEVAAVEEKAQAITEQAVEQVTSALADVDQQAATLTEQVTDKVAEVTTAASETVAAATAKVHIVTAQGLKYSPMVIKIAVGDTVSWDNMSSHDTQSMEGLIPADAAPWHSAMGENYQHTFTVEGIYVYKCTPHFGAGMGGVVIVGNPVNLDEIKAVEVKGAAKRLVKKAIKAAEAM